MKKIISIVLLLVIWSTGYSQTPQTFKYQAVVRAADGGTVANTIIGFKASILRNGANGTLVYSEIFSIATNDYGVVNLEIGNGTTVVGTFSTINWGTDTYFLRTEIDIAGGTNYQFMGSSQLLSVPYALFAENARNAADDYDKDSLNEIQTITKTGNTIAVSKNGGSVIDSDDQTLTKVGDSIALVNGGKVKDSDNQQLTLNGNTLHISNGNSVQIGGTIDLDWDPTNELQTISKHGDSITISNGNTIALNIDTTNQLQTLTKSGDSIVLSKNGGVVMDLDNQSITSSKSGNVVTLNITRGTGTNFDIRDNDSDSINELQVLSFDNDTLRLSKGNFVVLPISRIVPIGTCITSTSPTPPAGYTYSGNITESSDYWNTMAAPNQGYSKLVECNEKIYNICYGICQEYDPVSNLWTNKNTMPTPRNCDVLISAGNKIYAIGGSDFGGVSYLTKVEEFNPVSNTWATKIDLPAKIYSATVNNNRIYCIANKNYIEYDPSGNTYLVKTVLSDTIYSNTSIGSSLNKNIYIGRKNGKNAVFLYNITSNLWSSSILPDSIGIATNEAISGYQTVLNEKVFFMMYNISGYSGESGYYDLSTNSWTKITNIPCEMTANGVIAINNKIQILGREKISVSYSIPASYSYDIQNNSWKRIQSPPKDIEHAITCNGTIYGLYEPQLGSYIFIRQLFSYKEGVTYYTHCKN